LDVTIRPMVPADREAVIGLLHVLNVFEQRLVATRSERHDDAVACFEEDDAAMREQGGAHLVAAIDGKVVGYCGVHIKIAPAFIRSELRRFLNVSTLVVAEEARGQGIARRLLDEAEALARRDGLAAMVIGVVHGNVTAERLYRQQGFADYTHELIKLL
jgi:ribosomal protein S18 acetylase RimI-like enzyme